MGELNELEKWALETAKHIDTNLCKQADKYANGHRPDGSDRPYEDIQEKRIELIKAIMGD